MCGIIHCKRKNKKLANKMVLKRFDSQRTRGTDGFGFIEITDGIVGAEVRAQTEKIIKEKLLASKATEIMFHHRFPTSTPNFIEATHPILVSNSLLKYDYYVMHNGIISNDDDLKKLHNEQGFSYITEIRKKYVTKGNVYVTEMYNDSEALAVDFCLSLENDTTMLSEGSIAMVALQFEKKSRKAIALYFGRNIGNPLKIEDNKEFMCITSQTGKEVASDTLFRLDYASGKITEVKKHIGRYIVYGGQYDNYNYQYAGMEDDNYPKHPRKIPLQDGEEDDFDMDLWEELQYLEDEKRKAEMAGDYDRMTDIEIAIEEVLFELHEVEEPEPKGGDIEELGVGRHLKNVPKEF